MAEAIMTIFSIMAMPVKSEPADMTGERDMNERYRNIFWAKSRADNPSDLHRLEFHLADTGAVMEALLNQPTIRRATARSAGVQELCETTAARICVMAALHDIGKANISFQKKVWPSGEARHAGHNSDLMPLLNGRDQAGQERLLSSLTTLEEARQRWDEQDGHIVCALLLAALSHHGTPARLQNGHQAQRSHWYPDPSLGCPFEFIAKIDHLLRAWFPGAFDRDAPPIPGRPELQHQVAGLVTMADWIASDERHFPYRGEPDDNYMAEARRQAAQAVRTISVRNREEVAPRSESQATTKVLRGANQRERIGQALQHFEALLRDGLADSIYLALPDHGNPAETAHQVNRFLERILQEENLTAAVTTDSEGGHEEITQLTRPVIIGSISQATKSVLRTRYAHLRATCQSHSLLVIERPQTAGARCQELIRRVLHDHSELGGHALILCETDDEWNTEGESARTYGARLPDRLDRSIPFYDPDTGDNAAVMFPGDNDEDEQ